VPPVFNLLRHRGVESCLHAACDRRDVNVPWSGGGSSNPETGVVNSATVIVTNSADLRRGGRMPYSCTHCEDRSKTKGVR